MLFIWCISRNWCEMSYLKGKDIKIPFDCLWHCMTRSFQVTAHRHSNIVNIKPTEFDKF